MDAMRSLQTITSMEDAVWALHSSDAHLRTFVAGDRTGNVVGFTCTEYGGDYEPTVVGKMPTGKGVLAVG